MIEVPVELGARRYAVSIGHGASRLLGGLLAPFAGRPTLVVTTRKVWALHGHRLEPQLRKLGRPLHRAFVADGEEAKTVASLAALWQALFDAALGRDGLVVAVGGGAASDVAGLAAATWNRGIDWIAIPTTLLSMVDSSVGGKCAINHLAGARGRSGLVGDAAPMGPGPARRRDPMVKNLIGAFHQPRAVVADPELLETLPPRERQSGAYEILKCALLADRDLFRVLAAAPPRLVGWDRIALENAIADAVRVKAAVVERDEREGDLRRVLNLGHTLGHALEAVTRFRRFTHGEAVGWGLIGAAWIAHRKGLLRESGFDAIARAVDGLGPRPRVSTLDPAKLLVATSRDKKARAGSVTWVLPAAIGRVVLRQDVTAADVRAALKVMATREVRPRS